MLAGCSAGFLNVAKIKGAHNAMKTGMLAAEAIYNEVDKDGEIEGKELQVFNKMVKDSWVMRELKKSRNFKNGFDKGLWFGLAHAKLLSWTEGKEPYTLKHTKKDSDYTEEASKHKPIEYPKHDGVLTFDLLSNLMKSGTNHDHDQPSHLKVTPY